VIRRVASKDEGDPAFLASRSRLGPAAGMVMLEP
jgi:hypothetical protein